MLAEGGPGVQTEAKDEAGVPAFTERMPASATTVNLCTSPVSRPATKSWLVTVEVKDVKKKAAELVDLVRASKGEAGKATISLNPQGQMSAVIKMRVPLSVNDSLLRQFMNEGRVKERTQTPNPSVPENELSTASITMTLTGGNPIVPPMKAWERNSKRAFITALPVSRRRSSGSSPVCSSRCRGS